MSSPYLDPSTESKLQSLPGVDRKCRTCYSEIVCHGKKEESPGIYGKKEREEKKTPQMKGHAEPKGSSPLPLKVLRNYEEKKIK